MKHGKCVICGCTKTQFIKSKDVTGQGIMNKLINKLPFEMHLPGHNFTGPGTKFNKRLRERERLDRSIVERIIGTKMNFGMGLKLAEELHKPVSRKFPRRSVQVKSIDDIWAADLVNMQAFTREKSFIIRMSRGWLSCTPQKMKKNLV